MCNIFGTRVHSVYSARRRANARILSSNIFISHELSLSCNICDFIQHLKPVLLNLEFPFNYDAVNADC